MIEKFDFVGQIIIGGGLLSVFAETTHTALVDVPAITEFAVNRHSTMLVSYRPDIIACC